MQSFSQYVFTLIAVGLVTTTLEALLPRGNLKKFSAMAMGLVMLSLILRPLFGWLLPS